MSDITRSSAPPLQSTFVRKPRARRTKPVESGIDLLQSNPRLSPDGGGVAAVLVDARHPRLPRFVIDDVAGGPGP